MRDPNTEEITNLRVLVLALGEVQHFGWWKSQFLSPTGLSFLDRIYPRTKFASAIRSTFRAAQHIHDNAIGRGEVQHLFRLSALEFDLDQYLIEQENELWTKFSPFLSDKQSLLSKLSDLTGGSSVTQKVGPTSLAGKPETQLPLLASIYLNGFLANTPVFPYFTTQE